MKVEDYTQGKWEVSVKGAYDGGEISVVHSEYEHGKESYGWPGTEKCIILNGSVPDTFWDWMIIAAQDLADILTREAKGSRESLDAEIAREKRNAEIMAGWLMEDFKADAENFLKILDDALLKDIE